MKNFLLPAIICLVLVAFSSCSRCISVQDAANGKAKCGKWLK